MKTIASEYGSLCDALRERTGRAISSAMRLANEAVFYASVISTLGMIIERAGVEALEDSPALNDAMRALFEEAEAHIRKRGMEVLGKHFFN